jgi:hypothetical protein
MNDMNTAYEPSGHCEECWRLKAIEDAAKKGEGR